MNTFFLDRLNSEPHALAFAGQSTPWPVALADQSANHLSSTVAPASSSWDLAFSAGSASAETLSAE